MTIENDKKYKLTGEQIKDLASRFGVLSGEIGDLANLTTTDKTNLVAAINEAAGGGGGGGIIELTSADYNYPADNPTSVALWLLENGVYYIKDASVSARVSTSTVADRGTYIVADYSASVRQITAFNSAGVIYGAYKVTNVGAQENFDSFKSPAVVQTTGTATTTVMSQNAVTNMVFADPSIKRSVRIGDGARASGSAADAVGWNSSATGNKAVALGTAATASADGAIALGGNSSATQQGEVAIGTSQTNMGYNSSNYRLITGLYDPQSAHDAATKGYVDPTTGSSAPTTATVGRLGQIQIDTTTATAYMCVEADDVTPSYTWKQITA